MNKEFIPYELALELKQLGFDEPCNTCYDKLEMVASYGENVFDYKNYNTSGYVVSRPLYQQAFRWFREKYQLHFPIMVQHGGTWYFEKFSTKGFKKYEEAELECLKKLIEIVKNK